MHHLHNIRITGESQQAEDEECETVRMALKHYRAYLEKLEGVSHLTRDEIARCKSVETAIQSSRTKLIVNLLPLEKPSAVL